MKIINHIENNKVCFETLEIGDMFVCPSTPDVYYIKMLTVPDETETLFNAFNLNSSSRVRFNHDTCVLKVKGTLYIENI